MVPLRQRENTWPEPLLTVWNSLNRSSELVGALSHLKKSVSWAAPPLDALNQVILGFDTNALFRLGSTPAGVDIIDYLRSRGDLQLIVPGQAIQELWNNEVAVIQPIARALHRRLEELEKEATKLDHRFGAQGSTVRDAVSELVDAHSEYRDESALESFKTTLDLFESRASCGFVPRVDFWPLAEVRNHTKTPPGFKDDGYGDFFLWADFLYLLAQSEDLVPADGVILVTEDVKKDWSRAGAPHPILAAEARAIRDVPFHLWTLKQLGDWVAAKSG